ncbi:polyphenol oxidase, chloroplastic-like [Cynara cardunculus var. scolymus]|uniref:Polyphenol oxidase, C-terminal n=1 Tax=Cynara cardunculus var. scolymus TaxID=59895 RepID=A0A103XTV7_CYNCS|nr:polyphenol oxidase, chloroplastic-like [Cynara cardunculus var. scolymus]KVH96813.1 Polyphenol oxidase, C-terminal [Cynara cardunculus var. scolymus]
MAGISTAEATFPMSLEKPVTVVVARPAKKERDQEEEEEEVLVIEGIEIKRDEFVKFDVFINDEDEMPASGGGPEKAEFAGSFVNVPHKQRDGGGGMVIKTRLRLGISELLEGLEVGDDDEHVLVKLVPRCDDVHVTITGIKIEIE